MSTEAIVPIVAYNLAVLINPITELLSVLSSICCCGYLLILIVGARNTVNYNCVGIGADCVLSININIVNAVDIL